MINKSNYNSSPWNISVLKRLSYLRSCINDKVKVNIQIYEAADTSTFRYRAYNIYEILQNSSNWKSVYFFYNELDYIEEYFDKIKIITFVRCRWTHKAQNFITKARKFNIPIVYDVDDMVFDIKKIPLITNSINVPLGNDNELEYWFTYVGRIELLASLANKFTTTNYHLAKMLEIKFKEDCYIIPNYLNNSQFECSQSFVKRKSKNKRFKIGYFSGSPSHVNDFKLIMPELLNLLNKYNDIDIIVVGFMEFPKEFDCFLTLKRITFIPLVDFVELQYLISMVDVNLAPLVINEFTNCKSELKYFESALVRTITCASPTEVFNKVIRDGENGFLCKQGEWYEKIEKIHNKEVDVAMITETAFNEVILKYMGSAMIQQIEETYESIIS